MIDTHFSLRKQLLHDHPDLVIFISDVVLTAFNTAIGTVIPADVALASIHALDGILVISRSHDFKSTGVEDPAREWIFTNKERVQALLNIFAKLSSVDVHETGSTNAKRKNNQDREDDQSFAGVLFSIMVWRLRRVLIKQLDISQRSSALHQIRTLSMDRLYWFTSNVGKCVVDDAKQVFLHSDTAVTTAAPVVNDAEMTDDIVPQTPSSNEIWLKKHEQKWLRTQIALECFADILSVPDGSNDTNTSESNVEVEQDTVEDTEWEDLSDEEQEMAHVDNVDEDSEVMPETMSFDQNGAIQEDAMAKILLGNNANASRELMSLLLTLSTPSIPFGSVARSEKSRMDDAIQALLGVHVRAMGCLTNLLVPWSVLTMDNKVRDGVETVSWLQDESVNQIWSWDLKIMEEVLAGSGGNVQGLGELLDAMVLIAWTIARGRRGHLVCFSLKYLCDYSNIVAY